MPHRVPSGAVIGSGGGVHRRGVLLSAGGCSGSRRGSLGCEQRVSGEVWSRIGGAVRGPVSSGEDALLGVDGGGWSYLMTMSVLT